MEVGTISSGGKVERKSCNFQFKVQGGGEGNIECKCEKSNPATFSSTTPAAAAATDLSSKRG